MARKVAEGIAWTVAVVCLAIWGVGRLSAPLVSRVDVDRFEASQAATTGVKPAPDQSLWSPKRIRAWRETLAGDAPEPLGVLRIRRIGLEVAILPGTSDWTLNRAAGLIDGTALPGANGNSGIAAHRDGFFRCLKDIRIGDVVELDTRTGPERYKVEQVWIVMPEDVWVLDPTPSKSLTLVTCYPFYVVGDAPQRYIVRAVRVVPGA